MDNKKTIQKITENIKWSKGTQGGWCGSFVLKDGYSVSIVAEQNMKMREAKSLIKEKLPLRVIEVAAQENRIIM